MAGKQDVDTANDLSSKPRGQFSKSLLSLLVVSVGLIGLGGYDLISRYKTTHAPVSAEVLSAETVTNSTDNPSETKPDPEADYEVPAEMPRKIMLPTIHAEGFVQRVGIDQNQAVAVPSNVHIAGWYIHSARPGQEGLSIIDGHVSGKYSEGIFKRLDSLKVGDGFEIEFGDRTIKQFEVEHTINVATADAATELFKTDMSIKNQLKLITCGGKFDRSTQQYDERFIVSAKLIE